MVRDTDIPMIMTDTFSDYHDRSGDAGIKYFPVFGGIGRVTDNSEYGIMHDNDIGDISKYCCSRLL